MIDPEQARIQLSIYLEEYRMLKYEQVHRIEIRDNLVNASLIATGAVILYSFGKDPAKGPIPFALLALPVVDSILGWLHTSNDAKSCAIGHYLHDVLSERIFKIADSEYPELTGTHPCIFGWENEVRRLPFRRRRKITDLASSIFTFIVPGILALFAFWYWFPEQHKSDIVPVLASVVDLALLSGLSYWLLKDRDFCWTGPADADT